MYSVTSNRLAPISHFQYRNIYNKWQSAGNMFKLMFIGFKYV